MIGPGGRVVADVYDSMCTLRRATIRDLMDHTGRHKSSVWQAMCHLRTAQRVRIARIHRKGRAVTHVFELGANEAEPVDAWESANRAQMAEDVIRELEAMGEATMKDLATRVGARPGVLRYVMLDLMTTGEVIRRETARVGFVRFYVWSIPQRRREP